MYWLILMFVMNKRIYKFEFIVATYKGGFIGGEREILALHDRTNQRS